MQLLSNEEMHNVHGGSYIDGSCFYIISKLLSFIGKLLK